MTEKSDKQPSFEKSLERLEKIVADMEGGELSLEDMIARFEEGQKLIAFCGKKLDEVERRIEKLVKKGGKDVTVPLDEEESPDPDPEPNFEAEPELF